jgi:hypothetical protein
MITTPAVYGVVVNALGSIRDRLAGHAVQVMSSEKAFLAHFPFAAARPR